VTRPSDASVVPIRITLDGRTGVTLWATPWEEDGEEWQAFLGVGRHVLAFGTVEELSDYLHSGDENDLTDHPRWKDLVVLTPAELEPDQDYTFDLDRAYDLAAADPDPYTVSELSDLLDLVQRIAECCDDGTLLRLVEETPEFAELLSDDGSYSGSDGEQRWTAVGEVVDRSWEQLLERFSELIEWRGEPVSADTDTDTDAGSGSESGATAAVVDDEPTLSPVPAPPGTDVTGAVGEVEEADGGEEDEFSVWETAGILPISVTLPSGTGLTLRTYNGEEDDPVFLGSDLTIDLFGTAAGLQDYIRGDDDHDLAEMVTWPDIRDAEDLPVEPEPEEVYDLRGPSPDAVDLALEIADYCDLDGVTATLTRRASGEVPFDEWTAAINEIETCIRWHD